MRRVVALYRSSVGKKILMALTGFMWFGFLVGHMAGNLKAFQGASAFDDYAHHLRVLGEPILPRTGFLWTFRAIMLAAFVVHVLLAWQTSRQSHAARRWSYRKSEDLNFTFASRWMRWGGVFILVFVVFHILHMTTGQVHPDFVEGGAYHNLVTGLGSPVVAALYVVAMAVVALHLHHGIWSMFQTLGANHPKYAALRRPLSTVLAAIVFLGFISIPVAVLTGVVSQ
jgi:succinate dehydrogenase / fumarate reductase cytochrome b subunit